MHIHVALVTMKFSGLHNMEGHEITDVFIHVVTMLMGTTACLIGCDLDAAGCH